MNKVCGIIIGYDKDDAPQVEYHANVQLPGDYDTLCGMDANDEELMHYGFLNEVPRGQKITCSTCRAIFFSIKELGLRASDFAKESE